MVIRQHKILAMLVIGLWYALLGVMFLIVRPELAYSYGHWLGAFAGHLPQLTSTLSLPVLGPAFSTPSQDYSAVFWLVWGALFLPPLLLLRLIWRAGNSAVLPTVLLWGSVYALLATILGVFVAFGLWLPFSVA